MFVRLLFSDQIDLVLSCMALLLMQEASGMRRTDLENKNVLEFHDFDSGEMLGGLRLRTRLVGRNEEESGVHDGGSVQHGRHENIVTGTIDERDVSGSS